MTVHSRLAVREKEHEFLFVNYNPTSTEGQVAAREINAHVQVVYRKRGKLPKYRPWKPQSPKPGQLRLQLRLKEGKIQNRPCERKKHKQEMTATNRRSSRKKPDVDVKMETGGIAIYKGNSDPFSALPVEVNPLVNTVMAWFRADCIPSLWPVEKSVFGATMPAARRTEQSSLRSIHTSQLAYPFLASISATMARRTRNEQIRRFSLQLKASSYASIRQWFSQRSAMANVDTIYMMLSMVWAELWTGCLEASRTHLSMVAGILESSVDPEQLEEDLRVKLLSADVVLALNAMMLPVFKQPHWADESRYQHWRYDLTEEQSDALARYACDLHESLTERPVRSIFMRLRELVVVSELATRRKIKDYSVFRWMDLRLLKCESELVQLYLRPLSSYTNCGGNPAIVRCACIGALAWTGSSFSSSNRGLADALSERLEAASKDIQGLKVADRDLRAFSMWIVYLKTNLDRLKLPDKARNDIRAGDSGDAIVSDHHVRILNRFLYASI